MYSGNPAYYSIPTTPPGLSALPYVVGGFVAPYVGGVQAPYVPPSQSVHDAWMARYMNDPMYKAMMSGLYGQMGAQMGATAAALPIVDSLATVTGYSARDIRRDMLGAGRSFGRSTVGSFLMPLADMALNGIGLTGGSFVGMGDTAYRNRMVFSAPGSILDPYNREQQLSTMAGTSLSLNLLNGLMSKQNKDGTLSILPNAAFTQGFSREQLTQLFVDMAGSGAFNRYLQGDGVARGTMGGVTERYTTAASGYDISRFDFGSGDFTAGDKSRIRKNKEIADRIASETRDISDVFKSGIEAMGALRDMLKTVDGLNEKLTEVTNGSWKRSGAGAIEARNAVRNLNAVAMMYNLNPQEAWNGLLSNRNMMQEAAGFDDNMRAMGFSGGGLFGLRAQTTFMSNVEDMITARGFRDDPVRANALRMQAQQAIAHNMNAPAGRAATLLAWARQNGYVSEDDASVYRDRFISGDRASMSDALDRLLTTVFGAGERGRKMINDSMFFNSMRESMTDDAGDYAMRTMMAGAESEYMQREKMTAVNDRVSFSRDMLSRAGMSLKQTPEGIDQAVNSVFDSLMTIKNDKGEVDPDAAAAAENFKSMYGSMRQKGMKQSVAMQSAMNAFKSNPVTRRWSEIAERAVKRQYADNNDNLLENYGGREGTQAKAMAESLLRSKSMTGKQYSEVMKMLRKNRGKDALAYVEGINGSADPGIRKINEQLRDQTGKDFDKALETTKDKKYVESMLSVANEKGYGADYVSKALSGAVNAASAYSRSDRGEGDIAFFVDAMEKSGFMNVMGAEEYDKFVSGIIGSKGTGVDDKGVAISDKSIQDTIAGAGRKLANIKQVSVGNLKANGYGIGLESYWLNGKYAVNDKAARESQKAVLNRMANALQDSSVELSGSRDTLAQNFYKMMSGGNYRDLLGLYDRTGLLEKNGGGAYFKLFDEYTAAKKEFDDSTGAIDDAIGTMLSNKKYKEVDEFKKYLSDVDSVDADRMYSILEGGGLSYEELSAAMDAIDKKKVMVEKKKASESKAEELAKNDDFASALDTVIGNMTTADEAKKMYADSLSGLEKVDVSKISEGWFSSTFGDDLSKGYSMLKDVISDEDIVQRYNLAGIDSYTPERQKQARIRMGIEKAIGGDEDARKAMDKMRVAANEGVTKIRGEIVLKDGSNQQPALLECVSETNKL